MLDQMVRDYTNNIAEAESAVAQTIGNLRMLEDDYNEDVENARSWGNKALAASRKADEYRSSGDTADAVLTDAKALTEQVISLPGGVVCTDRPGTSTDVWAYPNIHGDLIVAANASGTRAYRVSAPST